MTWELALGLWGAFLSTILAIERFLRNRPTVWIELGSDEEHPLNIRIYNPAKHPIRVSRYEIIGQDVRLTSGQNLDTVIREAADKGTLYEKVGSKKELTLLVVGRLDKKRPLSIKLEWRSMRGLTLIPSPRLRIWKSSAELERLNEIRAEWGRFEI